MPQNEDLLLGRLAVRERICTQEQIDECLRIQTLNRTPAPLGDLLLFKGYVTETQLRDLLGRQHKKLMSCSSCRLSFTVLTLSEGRSARCPRCKGVLSESDTPGSTRTDAEFSTRRLPLAAPPPGPRVFYLCVICDHRFEDSPDPSGRLHCPSCQSTFTSR